jgi:peptidoglycan hydrolase-like protein with peptidoglycan-binding domain
MKHFVLITLTVFIAGLLMSGQAMGVELEKYRSTPSPPAEGLEAQEQDFQPLNRSQVQEMQRILSQKGFDPGDVDGYIGPDTQDAIREFQRSEGLAVTGNPDEQTLRALAPPEKHEFFGLAPEFEGEMQHPEGTRSLERY